jgi:hypothetical protein
LEFLTLDATFELALVAHKLPLPAMISSGMLAVVVASSPGYLKRNYDIRVHLFQ